MSDVKLYIPWPVIKMKSLFVCDRVVKKLSMFSFVYFGI